MINRRGIVLDAIHVSDMDEADTDDDTETGTDDDIADCVDDDTNDDTDTDIDADDDGRSNQIYRFLGARRSNLYDYIRVLEKASRVLV